MDLNKIIDDFIAWLNNVFISCKYFDECCRECFLRDIYYHSFGNNYISHLYDRTKRENKNEQNTFRYN